MMRNYWLLASSERSIKTEQNFDQCASEETTQQMQNLRLFETCGQQCALFKSVFSHTLNSSLCCFLMSLWNIDADYKGYQVSRRSVFKCEMSSKIICHMVWVATWQSCTYWADLKKKAHMNNSRLQWWLHKSIMNSGTKYIFSFGCSFSLADGIKDFLKNEIPLPTSFVKRNRRRTVWYWGCSIKTSLNSCSQTNTSPPW